MHGRAFIVDATRFLQCQQFVVVRVYWDRHSVSGAHCAVDSNKEDRRGRLPEDAYSLQRLVLLGVAGIG
jgi:hypothetical protein